MERMRAENSVNDLAPLLKIWRTVHRSNLAWKSLSQSVPELNFVFQQLAGLSTYFHSSGLRTLELRLVATDKNLQLLNLPRIFKVRYTVHCRTSKCSPDFLACTRSLSAVCCVERISELPHSPENLKILAVLADILTVFSRYRSEQFYVVKCCKHTHLYSARDALQSHDDCSQNAKPQNAKDLCQSYSRILHLHVYLRIALKFHNIQKNV